MTDWKRKLAACLHDSPCKALAIAVRTQHTLTLFRRGGFTDAEAQDFARAFAQPPGWVLPLATRHALAERPGMSRLLSPTSTSETLTP
jgi:hypothetical protein